MKYVFDLTDATLSDATALDGGSSISLVSSERTVGSSTELLLRLNETFGTPQDASSHGHTVINNGVLLGHVFDGAKTYGASFDGSSSLRIDSSESLENGVSWTFSCIMNLSNVSNIRTIAYKGSASQVDFHLYVESGRLKTKLGYNFLDDEVFIGPSISSGTPYRVGVSFASGLVRIFANATVEEHTASSGITRTSPHALYLGSEIASNYLVGALDEVEYLSVALDALGGDLESEFSPNAPYIDLPLPPSIFSNDTRLGHLGLTTTNSLGSLSAALVLNDQQTIFAAPNATEESLWQSSDDFQFHTLDFSGTLDLSDAVLRVFFLSNGRQPLTLTEVSLSYADSSSFHLGEDLEVRYGSSFQPFADAVIVENASQDLVFAKNDLAWDPGLPTQDDPFYTLRSMTLVADADFLSPSLTDDLFGAGELSATTNLLVTYGALIDDLDVSVRGHYLTVRTLDGMGIEVPYGTVSVSGEGLTFEDESTGSVTFSLPTGSYTVTISSLPIEDKVFSVTLTADQDLQVFISKPDVSQGEIARQFPVSQNLIEMEAYTFPIATGDTPTFKFWVKDSLTKLSKDLTGYTAYFTARNRFGDRAIVWDRVCQITSALGGRCEVTLTTSDTESDGEYEAELSIEDGSHVHTTINQVLIRIYEGLH